MKKESSNKIKIKLSVTMMKRLRYFSHIEGISIDYLLLEMIKEILDKRLSKIENNSMPSNLMTRNGYLT